MALLLFWVGRAQNSQEAEGGLFAVQCRKLVDLSALPAKNRLPVFTFSRESRERFFDAAHETQRQNSSAMGLAVSLCLNEAEMNQEFLLTASFLKTGCLPLQSTSARYSLTA
jgi:hypothetical protein